MIKSIVTSPDISLGDNVSSDRRRMGVEKVSLPRDHYFKVVTLSTNLFWRLVSHIINGSVHNLNQEGDRFPFLSHEMFRVDI